MIDYTKLQRVHELACIRGVLYKYGDCVDCGQKNGSLS